VVTNPQYVREIGRRGRKCIQKFGFFTKIGKLRIWREACGVFLAGAGEAGRRHRGCPFGVKSAAAGLIRSYAAPASAHSIVIIREGG